MCCCRIFENERSSSAGSSNWIYVNLLQCDVEKCSLSVLFQFNCLHKYINLTGWINTQFNGITRTEFSIFFIVKKCIKIKISILKFL